MSSITIPEHVTIIDDCTFASCDNLTSITIPKNLTMIGKSAFEYCFSLPSIIIPENVTTIGDYAFAWCNNLLDIDCKPTTPPALGEGAFRTDWELSMRKIYVPKKSVEVYKTAPGWKEYADYIVGK